MAEEADTAVAEAPALDTAAPVAEAPAAAPIAAAPAPKPAPTPALPVKAADTPAAAPPKTLAGGKVPVEPKTGTLADGADVETEEVKADWPDDWRDKMAGGDKETAALAKRFGSPAAILRALKEARQQISKGANVPAVLAEDATDEQKAEWRKARGVPDKPDGYDIKAPDGVTWTDEDKVYLDGFRKFAHDNNLPSDQVQALSQWYIDDQVARQQQQNVQVQKSQAAAAKELKAEWGRDFDRNVGLLREWGPKHYGADGWDAIVNSRTPNGGLVGDQPGFVRDCLERAMVDAEGKPIEAGGIGGGVSDGDAVKAHQELSAKAFSGDKAAKAKLNDPDYARKIEAVYERRAAFAERGKAA